MAKHYGPGPAHNCTIDFYDKDRINIQHEWLLKHPDSPFAPHELVGDVRHQIRIAEAGSERAISNVQMDSTLTPIANITPSQSAPVMALSQKTGR